MKRESLIRTLRRMGCFLKREGAAHSLWCNRETGHIEAVPRHVDIPERLANKITQALSNKRDDRK